jgi:hypothetical protein
MHGLSSSGDVQEIRASSGEVVEAIHICDEDGVELPTGEPGIVSFERDEAPFQYPARMVSGRLENSRESGPIACAAALGRSTTRATVTTKLNLVRGSVAGSGSAIQPSNVTTD